MELKASLTIPNVDIVIGNVMVMCLLHCSELWHCLKCENAFNQEEALVANGGRLRDCEIFANLR